MSLFAPLHVIPVFSPLLVLRSCVDILLGWGGFGGLGLALGVGSRGFSSLFLLRLIYTKKKKKCWNICFKWRKYFFLTTKGGINSWTLICLWNVMRLRTELVEALELDKEKGCELTLISCSLLCSSQEFISFFICRKKKTFCARFLRLLTWVPQHCLKKKLKK